jgi:DinB family protein
MDNLEETISAGLAERYKNLAGKVRTLAEPLTDEQFWGKPFAFGNSFGHLVLHLTGNLNYYIGSQIGGTGYVRDRDREFTETRHPPKEGTLKKFDEAVDLVVKTVRAQSAKEWSAAYAAARAENVGNRFNMVLQCAAHMDHHLGQMIYLCFELQRQIRG